MTVVALVSDLIFDARITAAAAEAGATLRTVRSVTAAETALPVATGLIVDMHAPGDPLALIASARRANPRLSIVAFLSHVETERAAAARSAGASEVLPRSAFAKRLPEILAAMSAPPAGEDGENGAAGEGREA